MTVDLTVLYCKKDIQNVLLGVSRMRSELENMKQENENLQAEVKRLREAEEETTQPKRGKKGSTTTAGLQATIRRLNTAIADVQKVITSALPSPITLAHIDAHDRKTKG